MTAVGKLKAEGERMQFASGMRRKVGDVVCYERLYVEFVYYFNEARDYFECHEVMEELWLGEGRNKLYQGLLQVAVGLYHYRNGNVSGAVKLFTQGIDKLQNYPKISLGIDLARLVAESREYVLKLQRIEEEPFDFYDLDLLVVDPDLAAQLSEMIRESKLK